MLKVMKTTQLHSQQKCPNKKMLGHCEMALSLRPAGSFDTTCTLKLLNRLVSQMRNTYSSLTQNSPKKGDEPLPSDLQMCCQIFKMTRNEIHRDTEKECWLPGNLFGVWMEMRGDTSVKLSYWEHNWHSPLCSQIVRTGPCNEQEAREMCALCYKGSTLV